MTSVASGVKNAALGEMYSNLVPMGVNVPDGFARRQMLIVISLG